MINQFDIILKSLEETDAMREAIKTMIEECKSHAKYTCELMRNDDGTYATDEDGNFISIMPEEGTYNYKLMQSYLMIASKLADTIN